MRILIDSYGAYLKKRGNRFVVEKEEGGEEFSSDKVEQIVILRGSAVSTDAINLAASKGIDIVFLERNGRPYARVYPCTLGGTTLTRRNQLEAYFSEKGAHLAKCFVRAKVENLGYFLRSLAKTRKSDAIKDSGNRILEFSGRVEALEGRIDAIRNKLLGIEGECSKIYFQALGDALPGKFYAGTRSKRPPRDVFNALLSYGYGILYSEVEKACIVSGLDPYLGFLHTDRYGKPSMVLDLIEEFRQAVVDRAMVTLAVRGEVSEGDVEVKQGCYLNGNGRRKAAEATMQRLGAEINYRGKKISFADAITGQARGIVRYINGEAGEYKPFIYRW